MLANEKLLNVAPGPTRFRWVVAAFALAGSAMTGLLGWQLFDNTPAYWCAVAKVSSAEATTACVTILLELLKNKDHVNLGLLVIVGLTVLSLAAVALGVRIEAKGSAEGFETKIGPDNTTVTNGDASVTIPTPPAGENQ